MSQTNSKTYVMCAAALVVGMVLGFLLGSSGKNQAYQAGLVMGRAEAEREYQKKIEAAFPSLPEAAEIFSVSGKIKKIEGNSLTLEIMLPTPNPLEEPERKTVVVGVANAEIVKEVPKSPAELAEEAEEFAAGESETPLSFYNEEAADLSEIKIGDSVTAESEINIKGKTTFEAAKIIIMSAF